MLYRTLNTRNTHPARGFKRPKTTLFYIYKEAVDNVSTEQTDGYILLTHPITSLADTIDIHDNDYIPHLFSYQKQTKDILIPINGRPAPARTYLSTEAASIEKKDKGWIDITKNKTILNWSLETNKNTYYNWAMTEFPFQSANAEDYINCINKALPFL